MQLSTGMLVPLEKLRPWDKNPRNINEDDFSRLKYQIEHLGVYKPMLAMPDGESFVVLGGNMRLKALRALNKSEVWVSVVDVYQKPDQTGWFVKINDVEQNQSFESREQAMTEYALSDNDRAGFYDANLLEQLKKDFPAVDWQKYAVDVDKPMTIIELLDSLAKDQLSDEYSQNIGEVVYEPKETKHEISELFQRETKYDEEINKIPNEGVRAILQARVAYFSRFDFAKIADYYAYQATPEEKRLFEKLALVLLDKDQLVEHGYSEVIESIEKGEANGTPQA